jgi:hypothetical protein
MRRSGRRLLRPTYLQGLCAREHAGQIRVNPRHGRAAQPSQLLCVFCVFRVLCGPKLLHAFPVVPWSRAPQCTTPTCNPVAAGRIELDGLPMK